MNCDSTTGREARLRMGLLAALFVLLPAVLGCPKSDEPAYYIKRLQKADEEVQRRAVEELRRMHKKAMPYITGRQAGEKEKTQEAAIDSPNPNVRMGCADFLAKVRRIESLEALGELIEDEDKAVRLKAIEAVSILAQMWKKKSVELLGRAFHDADPECVKLAGEGLRDMKAEEATDVLRLEFEAGQGIQAIYAAKLLYETEPGPEIAQRLLEGLISDAMSVRDAAKENVMELEHKIVEPLVAFVDRPEGGTARAGMALEDLRDKLIEELDVILDSRRAAEMLAALGAIADQESIDKLKEDLYGTKLESTWRVAAARGMATGALSSRSTPAQKTDIKSVLTGLLNDEDEDNRIRIGAAIALCELREENAVLYLLDELDRFQEEIQQENISDARRDDLTQLRIWAQEALTTAGEFVVDFLMQRMRRPDAGPIIRWAAAKTFGELKTDRAVPQLGKFMVVQKDPKIAVAADGEITRINIGKPVAEADVDSFALLFEGAEAGARLGPQDVKDWSGLSEADVGKAQQMLEVFEHPAYVRWTAAIALGQIGGERALTLLRQAEAAESEFLERLRMNSNLKNFRKRANVVNGLIGQHEDVVFYIRHALEDLEGAT